MPGSFNHAMDTYEHESEHRKKRRRREIAPTPVNARLTFDDNVKGDAALISPSLWQLLHPAQPLNGKQPAQPPRNRRLTLIM